MRRSHTHTHTQRHHFSGTNVCLHIYAGKLQSTDQWGLLSKYHKDKEPAPTGKTEFDQSKALFQVRITFQLLKLMNSLYLLMKPSVANKDDSVFVLFTAHSKNNIVKALLYKPEAARSKKKKKNRKMILQSISHPTTRTSMSRIINARIFLDHFISPICLLVVKYVSCRTVQKICRPHAAAEHRNCQPTTPSSPLGHIVDVL